MHAVLDDLKLDTCAAMGSQSLGQAWHELLERRVFAGSQHQTYADRAPLCRIEFFICWKGPVYLQTNTQMFGKSVGLRVMRHISVAENIAIVEKVAEVNSLAPGNQLLGQIG